MLQRIKDFFIPQAVNCKNIRPMTGWEMYGLDMVVFGIIGIAFLVFIGLEIKIHRKR